MSERSPESPTLRSESPWGGFHDLMQYRVQDILLVSSLYDSFILAEDGQLNERILAESLELNLRHVPGVTRVSTGAEALALARKEPRFNLVITSLHVGDMDAIGLARRLKDEGLKAHVVLLAYDNRELTGFLEARDASELDGIFLWQGDVRILLAIVKFVEDRMNVAHDTGVMGVQAIIVVEDSVPLLLFLPAGDLHRGDAPLAEPGARRGQPLSQAAAGAGAPEDPPLPHLRGGVGATSRPTGTTSSASSPTSSSRAAACSRHGPASSSRAASAKSSPTSRSCCSRAAARTRRWRSSGGLVPAQGLAGAPSAAPALHGRELRLRRLRLPPARRHRVGRAHDLKTLEEMLHTVPADCLAYHGERNHFSNWLKARTEFALAHSLRPRTVADFGGLEDLRGDLIQAIQEYRAERNRRIVADFDRATFDGRGLLAHRRRLARRQGSRPRLRERAPRRQPGPRPFPEREDLRSVRRRPRHGRLRPVPRRERPAGLRDRVRRRRGHPTPLPRGRVSRGDGAGSGRVPRGGSATRSPCAPRACWRTRSTSPSPASTTRTCCRTTTAAARSASRSSWTRSSASTPRRSATTPRPTSTPRPTASKRRRWR